MRQILIPVLLISRNSLRRCSVRKYFFRNFANLIIRKHLRQSLFFNKVAGLRTATLLKKRPWHRCFVVNFEKYLKTPFLQNTFGRLLVDFFDSSKILVLAPWYFRPAPRFAPTTIHANPRQNFIDQRQNFINPHNPRDTRNYMT